MAKKKVSRTRQPRLKDEPTITTELQQKAVSTNNLAIVAGSIYAAKWLDNIRVYGPNQLGNRELMKLSVMEAKDLLEMCSE